MKDSTAFRVSRVAEALAEAQRLRTLTIDGKALQQADKNMLQIITCCTAWVLLDGINIYKSSGTLYRKNINRPEEILENMKR